jgi:hypothetical protein
MRMTNQLHWTIDHDEIRKWIEGRGGVPALSVIKETKIPIINFAHGLPHATEVTWEEWFRIFDEDHYAFVCKETRFDGMQSQFCQLIPRDSDAPLTGYTDLDE